MGVKEPLPESIVAQLAQATWSDRLRDGVHLLGSAGALIASHFTLARRTRRFRWRLDDALGNSRPDLSRWRMDEFGGVLSQSRTPASAALGRPLGERLLGDDLLRPASQMRRKMVR